MGNVTSAKHSSAHHSPAFLEIVRGMAGKGTSWKQA